jgi:hypothetical protein
VVRAGECRGSKSQLERFTYTLSSTNSAREMAHTCLNLTQRWKLDLDHNGNPAKTGSYKNMIKQYYYQALVKAAAGKGREVKPAHSTATRTISGACSPLIIN